MFIEIFYFVFFLFVFIVFLIEKKILDKRSDRINPGRADHIQADKLEGLNRLIVRCLQVVFYFYFLFTLVNFIIGVNLPWIRMGIANWMRITGCIVGINSMVFLWWVFQHLAGNWAEPNQLRDNHELVTTGPYHWIRHPLYLAADLWLLGLILISDFSLFVLFLPLSHWLLWRRAKMEEKLLINKFGDKYKKYRAQTGMFFPKITRL